MQIRRLIIDRYGKLSELPVVSFVHIDADKVASQISGLRTGNTYHGEDILFRDAEKVAATMSSQEVNDLAQGLERRSSHELERPYDCIGCWFAPQLLKNIKAIEDGASGIRPVGRLAFFHNYRKIQEAIKVAENRTRGHEKKLLEKGFLVEPGLNIFVVGSLCGGTGSGMFLDVAYSLRRAYSDKENQIVGYLIISPELYGNTPSMNANTYAALKELNYIYFPRDLTVQVSLNHIKLKLLSFWLNGEGQSPDTQALLERFLLNWRSDRDGRDIFTLKLEEAAQDNNKTFIQTINNWKNQL